MDNSEIKLFLDKAKEFAEQEIKPYASKFENDEKIPYDLIKEMGKEKLLTPNLPKEYGGLGLDSISYGHYTEIVGKACCNVRTLLTVHGYMVSEIILKYGTEYQKLKYLSKMSRGEKIGAFALSEPEIGSDAKKVRTTYEKKQNKFILNGEKKWISLGGIANFFLVIASEQNNVSAFIVDNDTKGITVNKIEGLMASKASHIAQIIFDNVEIPEENLVGGLGNGFSYIVNSALNNGRYSIAWAGVAIAQAALESMICYSKDRMQFGKKICEFQLIQEMTTDALTGVESSRELCLKAGRLRDEGDDNSIMMTNMAKYYSSKVAVKVTNDAIQVHGGNGCCNTFPVERYFREAKILEIIEGTSQIQQQLISNYAFSKYRYLKSYKE